MLADVQCARVCMWMSVILLISSGVHTLTGFAYADVLGTLGLVVFSVREGQECFEKAASDNFVLVMRDPIFCNGKPLQLFTSTQT